MKLTRTWIDTALTHGQRTQLVDWLIERAGANPTGEQIRAAIFELFPELEPPSVQACLTWRAKAWAVEVDRRALREDAEAARILADAAGDQVAEANKKMLDVLVFDDLRRLRAGEDVALERVHGLMLSAARATAAVQRVRKTDVEVELIKARLEELERKQSAAQAVAQDTSLTPEQRAERMKEALGLA